MTSQWRIMPYHPTRKCACWAPVKLIAKYCLKHWEQLRNLRWRLSMLKNNREVYIEKYVNLYNFLNRCKLEYWKWIAEVKNAPRKKKQK